MVQSTQFFGPRRFAKTMAVIATGAALAATTARPTYAGGNGAIAAGVIGGVGLGLLAADAYPPPYGVAPIDVDGPPDDFGPVGPVGPSPCHDILVESFDPYAGAYVETPRRVCDGD